MSQTINELRTEFSLNPAQHLENHIIFYLFNTDELRSSMSKEGVVDNGIVNVQRLLEEKKKEEKLISEDYDTELSIDDYIGRGAR
jgi:hypothetical protein